MNTIAAFSKPEEAHLLRMRLEDMGIPAYVQDENLIQMDWTLSNAVGGVRVQVADEDVQAAAEALAEDKGADPDSPQPVADASFSAGVLLAAALVILLGPLGYLGVLFGRQRGGKATGFV